MYKDLVTSSRIELGALEIVSTPLVITKILRLHQIVCGNLKDDNGKEHSISSNRVNTLLEILEETDESIIIWCNYIADITKISEALIKQFGADSMVLYYGSVKSDDRVDAVNKFQSGKARFFVGQSRTGGFGLTLTKATTVIYFSNNYDLEVRMQSEDRAHRIGQEVSVTYIDLVAPNTIDEKIIKTLKAKRSLSMKVMGDSWKDWIK
jgi:SNF2 family DNA or RNA helicase